MEGNERTRMRNVVMGRKFNSSSMLCTVGKAECEKSHLLPKL